VGVGSSSLKGEVDVLAGIASSIMDFKG
jgi:hypothetical protein